MVALDAEIPFPAVRHQPVRPPSDPVAAALPEGPLQVTIYRVALVPSAPLAAAVTVFAAALALRTTPPAATGRVRYLLRSRMTT